MIGLLACINAKRCLLSVVSVRKFHHYVCKLKVVRDFGHTCFGESILVIFGTAIVDCLNAVLKTVQTSFALVLEQDPIPIPIKADAECQVQPRRILPSSF